MAPQPFELGLFALSCVVAAVGGVRLAARQKAVDVPDYRQRWHLRLRTFGASRWWYKPRVARSLNVPR